MLSRQEGAGRWAKKKKKKKGAEVFVFLFMLHR